MKPVEAYGDLMQLDRPVLSTREAAARWQTSSGTAGRRLRGMEDAGIVRNLRRGLWSLDPRIAPFAVPHFLTAPFPAYVSLWSALACHGMIEQIPRQISVASLDRSRRIDTSIGTFSIHHLAGEVFGGFTGSERSGYLALPEKAIFDTIYVRAAAGGKAYFPELTLPDGFDHDALDDWNQRIESSRLRTLVTRGVRDTLRGASEG